MENEENVSTLVWSARRHAVAAALALDAALGEDCRVDLGDAVGGGEFAADSALEVLVLCVDELRQACDLL